jgi:hypothetical protein
MNHPVILHKYRGFLVRVVKNACASHPFEWTIEGTTNSTKKFVTGLHLEAKKKIFYVHPKYYPEYEMFRFRALGNKLRRIYDPTSMPKARGVCSALDYGKTEVDYLLAGSKRASKRFQCYR